MVTNIQHPCPGEGRPQCPKFLLVKTVCTSSRFCLCCISGQSCAFPAHAWVTLQIGKWAVTFDREITKEKLQGLNRQMQRQASPISEMQKNAKKKKNTRFRFPHQTSQDVEEQAPYPRASLSGG